MEKYPQDWSKIEFVRRGGKSAEADRVLDLQDGSPILLRFFIKAQVDKPLTYEANLILAGQRIRGVGHCETERRYFYGKIRIPKGWHENIVNPNLVQGDDNYNIHRSLPDFLFTDLVDFTRKTAAMWHIVLPPAELL